MPRIKDTYNLTCGCGFFGIPKVGFCEKHLNLWNKFKHLDRTLQTFRTVSGDIQGLNKFIIFLDSLEKGES